MGKCQSQPNQGQNLQFTQIIYQAQKNQEKKDKISTICSQVQQDLPSSMFAKQVNTVPQNNENVKKRFHQLGPFDYNNCGNFQSGKPLNVYKLQNGAIYRGQWKLRKPHGKGIYYLPDGSFFQGVSKNGQIQGFGRIIHQNGDYFQGQLKQGKAQGQGKYVENDIVYKGLFHNNLQHGIGIQSSTQYEFKGTFEEGLKKNGKLLLKNNSIYQYEGEFKNNKYHGKGTLINDIGKYFGQFSQGLKDGFGRFTWTDGSYYQGQYVNDQKQGRGKLFDKHKKVIKQGVWQNNHFLN